MASAKNQGKQKPQLPYWQSPYVDWQTDVPPGWSIYALHLRESRAKARIPAVVEALSLLRAYDPIALLNGPISTEKRIVWLAIDARYDDAAAELLRFLGYTWKVARFTPQTSGETVRWRGESYTREVVYEEDERLMRERAPDRRTFLLTKPDGIVIPVQGYRGDGTALAKRGLPAADARLLVNLVRPHDINATRLLDPFAGIGGVVIEARAQGYAVFSTDIDSVVARGVAHFGARHTVANAAALPFASATFDAIATEPPYDEETRDILPSIMSELYRVLKPDRHIAMLAAAWQVEILRQSANEHGLHEILVSPIDRKGLDVTVLVWKKHL